MAKSAEEQIKELEERRAQLNARIQRIKAKENAKARKARTHRLIEVGALVESAVGVECDEAVRETMALNLNSNVCVVEPDGTRRSVRLAELLTKPRNAPQTAERRQSVQEQPRPAFGAQSAPQDAPQDAQTVRPARPLTGDDLLQAQRRIEQQRRERVF